MNPGSEYEPPTNPHQTPGGRFERPGPPVPHPQPTPPGRQQGPPPGRPSGPQQGPQQGWPPHPQQGPPPPNQPSGPQQGPLPGQPSQGMAASPYGVRPVPPQGMPPTMPSLPPTMPPMPLPSARPPKRPAWLLPALAAALVVLVAAGGVGAYYVYGKTSDDSPAPPSATGSAQPKPGAAKAIDVCSMLPKEEVERLVPDATVGGSSRDSEYAVVFGCNWANQRISFGEYWRSREIDVKIDQYKGEGAKTGRAMAQNGYEFDRRGAAFSATAKPSLDPDESQEISAVKDIENVGDSAFAQYTFRRSGTTLWYAYGQAHARVGDMTIKVKFQASQQRKDAQLLTNETVQAITEENAIREVSGLVAHFAKGAAAWQASNPNVLAEPQPSATVSPSGTPEPSPTVLAAFPADCSAVTETATKLVPEAATRARGITVGGDNQTECRWLNRELSGGEGIAKIRSAMITAHRFTNRTGDGDAAAAKEYFTGELGSDRNMAQTRLGAITWSEVTEVEGLGDTAYRQFVETKSGEVFASSGSVVVRKGPIVIRIDYSGHQRPEGEATNSPKVVLMPEKEAMAGALTLAKAYVAALGEQPAGS